MAARVDSMGILGSTDSYAYLTRERASESLLWQNSKPETSRRCCVGSVSTLAILHLAKVAQLAGTDALLLPVVIYQSLRN